MGKLALAAVGACALALSGFALAAQVPVSLSVDGPQPSTVTVNWGDTVAFTNADTEAHGILIPGVGVTSPDIPPGGTFLQLFDKKKGTFGFVQTGSKRRTGQVVVKLQGSVTLEATPQKIAFGHSVTLAGVSPYPNSPVVLSQRRTGTTTTTELLTVNAAEDGSYIGSFFPQFGSRLRASVALGQLRSGFVTVKVAPRISIVVRPTVQQVGRTVTVTGQIAPSDAAKTAQLSRYNAKRKTWDRVDTEEVSSSGAVRFRWKAAKGRSLLRLSVARADLRPGYEPAVSRWVAVKGLEPAR